MAVVGEVAVNLTAKTDQLERGLNKGAKSVASFQQRLKQTFGEESVLGNFGKALRGAGVAAGLTAVAAGITQITNSVRDLNIELARGNISDAEFNSELLKKIPFFGQGFALGEALRQGFTKEAQLIQDAAKLGDKADKATAESLLRQAKIKETAEKMRGIESGFMAKMATAGMPEGQAAVEGFLSSNSQKFFTQPQLAGLRTIAEAYDRFMASRKAQEEELAKIENERMERIEKNRRVIDQLNSAAARVVSDTRTPQEKFAAKRNELFTLLGLRLIDPNTFGRGLKMAQEELDKALAKPEEAIPTLSSPATNRATLALERAAFGRNGPVEGNKIAKEQLTVLKKIEKKVGNAAGFNLN